MSRLTSNCFWRDSASHLKQLKQKWKKNMDRTPLKKITSESLHESPINHNILYKRTCNKLKDLKSEVELLILSMIKQIEIDWVKRMLMDTNPLTTLYDILEELVSVVSCLKQMKNEIMLLI